ncbi:MAG: Grx4 family monothiol glutaredoxin [Gammaproteobacteria bacterium]|nr:Grx4 family monothiol glutaredoxin [Gammaproteobacteria bacterium]
MSDVLERIKSQVESNPVLLYMKGTPQMPMCGFSARTVEVLKGYGKEFAFVNVLADPEIRANLPQFSEWPTFPQLFINGELVGGCDIVMEMNESGELQPMVEAAAAG